MSLSKVGVRRVGGLLVGAWVVAIAAPARATPYESGGKVDEYIGSYTEHVPIVVPPFHGIEPKLSIEYNSARGNGLVGVGWSLQGLSVIELADGSFTSGGANYVLDGQMLIPCSDQTDTIPDPNNNLFVVLRSPSCTTGGMTGSNRRTFSTLAETYLRIEKGSIGEPNDVFVVWQKNGTRSIYRKANSEASTGTVLNEKYLLREVKDADGNTVTYNWSGTASGFTFNAPSSIEYNGTKIRFYYDRFASTSPSASSETYSEHGKLITVDRRLATIDVCVANGADCNRNAPDPNRARAYKLTYKTSATTLRALLTSVQMFGRNAVISGATSDTGLVTAGDALPAMTFAWSDAAASYGAVTIGAVADWGTDWTRGMIDFNGDGKTDFCRAAGGGPNANMLCSMSTGWGLTESWVGQVADWGGDHDGAWVDWNGDGKTDYCRLVCEDSGGGSCEFWETKHYKLRCAISTGTGIVDGQVGAEIPASEIADVGARWFTDWNGDGRADWCRAFDDANDNSIGSKKLKCALSLQSGGYVDQNIASFNHQESMSTVLGGPASRAMVDWNGDGRMDFCRIVVDAGVYSLTCMMGTAYEFDRDHLAWVYGNEAVIGTIADFGAADSQYWVDANGDGKTDFCRLSTSQSSGTIDCAISMGRTLTDVTGWTHAASGSAETRRWGDLNGDGKADLCVDDGVRHQCLESFGMTGGVTIPTGNATPGFYEKHWMVDWNGDGRAEYCFNSGSAGGSGSVLTCLRRTNPVLSDLATTFTNGIGGTTTVGYGSSSAYGQAFPDLAVVERVTRSGGQEGPIAHTYSYAGGRYDVFSRRFLGFSVVTVSDPCQGSETAPFVCPFTTTAYRLDWRWPTKPSTVTRSGGSPTQIFTKTSYVYADTTERPYRSDLVQETTTVFEGTASSSTTRHRDYDSFGNVVVLSDVGSDERDLSFGFFPNLADYIVDKPSFITGSTASGGSNVQLTDVRYMYDGNTAWNAPPTRGHATLMLAWLDTTGTYIASRAEFDGFGNVSQEIDALGNVVKYDVDPTFHQYITGVTQAFGSTTTAQQSSTTVWNPRCSEKIQETDANGNSTTFSFDLLCRKTGADLPGGGYEAIIYDASLVGTSGQYTEVLRPGATGPSANGVIWERTYFDGLGRTTKVIRRGPRSNGLPAGSKDIVAAQYTYTARGSIATSTRPHYAIDPAYTYSYGYDLRDRQTSAVLPSANVGGQYQPGDSKTTSYELLQSRTVDNMGHGEVTKVNDRGQRLWVCTSAGNQCLEDMTYYEYDARGNPSRTQQLVNHSSQWATWTSTFDSLGRKTATSDPDAGDRVYIYDAVGNLVDELDANGAQTHHTYDALRRRTSKTINYCSIRGGKCLGPRPVTVTWTYDQARAGYANIGRLTSMTDPSGTATYNYDVDGNLIQGGRTVDGNAFAFTKRYDLGGRLLSTAYPDGTNVGTATDSLDYDEAGRLNYVPGFVVDAQYDAASRLTSYMATNGSESAFRTDNPRGQISEYSTIGMPSNGPRAILGDYAVSNTNSANQNYQALKITPAVAVGQTITVSTCVSDVTGASGTGDTYLRLYWKGPTQQYEWQVAQNDSAGGGCGSLSTISYVVPLNGDGVYTVRAGCAGSASCTGTVAARLETAGPNLALNKAVYMSSVLDPSCGPPSAAVDGMTSGFWCTSSSMAHSQYETAPWLFVDLGSMQTIDHIHVWNRSDNLCDLTCQARLSNFDIYVLDSSNNWEPIANIPGTAGYPTRIAGGNRQTQYVMIQLRGTDYLNLPEIEVFGAGTPGVLYTAPLLHDVKIVRDPDGRVTQIKSNRPNESWTYGYSPNGLHQLTSATSTYDPVLNQTFAYDNGNLTSGPSGTATYGTATDHPHALMSAAGYTYAYDGNGQQVSASPGGYTFGWDGGGRLTSIGGVGYTYDADGYRLKKRFDGVDTIYLGDDYEITNGLHTKYVSLGGRLVAKQQGANPPTWLYTDYQGSVVYGLDHDGVRVFSASYRPYGEAVVGSAPDARGFTGQRNDEAGMLYLHARFAHPGLGRFLSPDPTTPTARPIGMNRYAYAQNDPINRTDIDGLGFWEDAGAMITHSAGQAAATLKHLNLEEGIDGINGLLREISGGAINPEPASHYLYGFNMGIGNTLALLPNSINAAGRGDWNRFGKSVASEVVVSTAIAVSIMSYGTAAAPAIAASSALLVPFALTAINTGGNIPLALRNSLGVIPGMIMMGGKERRPESSMAIRSSSGGAEWTDSSAVGLGAGGVFGTVFGAFMSANDYVAVESRNQAIGLSSTSQLSCGGSLFGYGYTQSQPR